MLNLIGQFCTKIMSSIRKRLFMFYEHRAVVMVYIYIESFWLRLLYHHYHLLLVAAILNGITPFRKNLYNLLSGIMG